MIDVIILIYVGDYEENSIYSTISTPIATSRWAIFGRESIEEIDKLEELRGKRVVIIQGGHYPDSIFTFLQKNCNTTLAPDERAALKLVDDKVAFAVIGEERTLSLLSEKYGVKELLDDGLGTLKISLAYHKNITPVEFVDGVNQSLKSFLNSEFSDSLKVIWEIDNKQQ